MTTPAAPGVVDLRGVEFHSLTETGAIGFILDRLDQGRGGWVVTPNVDILRKLNLNRSLRRLCRSADLVVADGVPLIWASRVQGTPLPERVAGSSLVSSLSGAAAERGRSIYLLGGDPGTAEAAALELRTRFPGLVVAGVDCPPLGFDRSDSRVAQIVAELKAAKPDIVYVALGFPKQEKLICRLRDVLPRAWWLGVGISFSYMCGRVRRSPVWMRRLGLEWTYRLVQEPERLVRRYLLDGLPFAVELFSSALLGRLQRRRRGESTGSRGHQASRVSGKP